VEKQRMHDEHLHISRIPFISILTFHGEEQLKLRRVSNGSAASAKRRGGAAIPATPPIFLDCGPSAG
jgi:hypothetical protein